MWQLIVGIFIIILLIIILYGLLGRYYQKHGMVSTPKKTIKVKDTPKDKNVPKRLIQQRKEVTKMYNFRKTEKKWQDYWEENKTFKTDTKDFSKPKYYALDMFPYPSE